MDKPLQRFKQLIKKALPDSVVEADAPARPEGSWWLDVTIGKRRRTLEYRAGKGFGLFLDEQSYGEGPSEIYRTPERAAKRILQLAMANKSVRLNLKGLRELYGQSQITLARKVGVKQSAISRFENRDEVKLSTLAAAVKALGGKLEVRAHFADADVPISLVTSKR